MSKLIFNFDFLTDSTSLDDEDPLENLGVAGRNLITGQTISLEGFISKFSSKKLNPMLKTTESKSNLNFSGVFGKSSDKKPKRLTCKILAVKVCSSIIIALLIGFRDST